MTSEQLTAAWAAPSNAIPATEAKSLTAAFLDEIKNRQRRSVVGLAIVAVAFAAISVLSVAAVVTQDDLQWKHALNFAGMNALTWGGWAVAVARHVAKNRPLASAGVAVRDALQLALKQRRLHRSHLRVIAIGLVFSVPLVALSIRQMQELGRLAPEDLPLRIGFAVCTYAVALACLGSDYFGRTKQEIDRLESLLAECDAVSQSTNATPEQGES